MFAVAGTSTYPGLSLLQGNYFRLPITGRRLATGFDREINMANMHEWNTIGNTVEDLVVPETSSRLGGIKRSLL